MNKEIHEGWTANHFITDLEPMVNFIMAGKAMTSPFKTKSELKAWLVDNQPLYKKPIPKVINYFAKKHNLS